MCGRFVQLPVIDFGQPGLADLAPGLAEIQPSYNLAPTQRASVILDRGEGRQVTRLAWGLLPFWAKAKGLQGSTINARIETVATKPAFRSAFKKRRCVIPMAGYYEWSVSPEDGKKDPWFIHATGPLLAADEHHWRLQQVVHRGLADLNDLPREVFLPRFFDVRGQVADVFWMVVPVSGAAVANLRHQDWPPPFG